MSQKLKITIVLSVLSTVCIVYLYNNNKLGPLRSVYHSISMSSGLRKPTNLIDPNIKKTFDYSGFFMDLDGNEVSLYDYKGKTLFINIWASWCRPCRSEMPFIAQLYESIKDKEDIKIILINVDNDLEKVKKYLLQNNYQLPVIHAKYELDGSLKFNSLPTTYVVNKNAEIIFYQEGMSNFNTPEFKSFLMNAGTY